MQFGRFLGTPAHSLKFDLGNRSWEIDRTSTLPITLLVDKLFAYFAENLELDLSILD